LQGNIILFMKTLQQSSWPLLSMYCLQLFARDFVSYTQCQLDTGNDQQNYARPTIQCISNYSNSTSTIEKKQHNSWAITSSFFMIPSTACQGDISMIFPTCRSYLKMTYISKIKSGWSALPNVFMVEKAHFPCYNIFLGSFSTWPSGTGSRPWLPLKFHWDPLGTLTSWDLFRAQLSIGAPNEALGWKRPAEIDRRLLTMKTWIKHDQ